MMTTAQVRRSFELVRDWADPEPFPELEKDVTRRNGWEFLQVGDKLRACEKCQGLGKGGKIVALGVITVLDVRRERLARMILNPKYGREECRREGFPEMTPAQFVAFFCKSHNGVTPDSLITRIEFGYG